jgi:pimeloyl-ACP methyl ester carboxylesterase
MPDTQPYQVRSAARSQHLKLRGQSTHLLVWGDLALACEAMPLTVLAHGWMDVGASFQFLVDALRQQPGWAERPIVALDWRGFGDSYTASGPVPEGDYAYLDYLADLDALVDQLSPDHPIDLVGHSMGGNVVMLYAGVRPERIRRLVNLEGFGMPAGRPDEAPERLVKWLDGLKAPVALSDYASVGAVAARLRKNNPLLREAFALWLAGHWAHEQGGRWLIKADAAHTRPGPHIYRVDEVLACWARITAPVLFVEGNQTPAYLFFKGNYTPDEFQQRLSRVPNVRREVVAQAAHMLHHDQPEALAVLLAGFLMTDVVPR